MEGSRGRTALAERSKLERRVLAASPNPEINYAFGVLDTVAKTLTVMRAEYDVAETQAKFVGVGLPDVLAQRLGVGR